MRAARFGFWALYLFLSLTLSATEPWIHSASQPGDFPLVAAQRAAPLYYAAEDARVVAIALGDLASDLKRVSGVQPTVAVDATNASGPVVLAGTLGRSPLMDRLVTQRKLDLSALRGAWESFVITTVDRPLPGVPRALVIAGSDRRGTAYGIYALSEAIGVSPWYWWADVVPQPQAALYVAAGTRRFGPPSVKYRGIFINDEDWGLQPWAAKTFEPEHGGIGPKTYAKVFELMLRLKANTVWPAMHACTKAFNSFAENGPLADDYAIVMGSSHAEPMLRDNVGEWTEAHEKYNYVTNREGVKAYWEERMKTNGRFENIYTLGMRGIHDSGIQGAKTDAERIKILEQVFADQRAMIAQYAHPDANKPTPPAERPNPSVGEPGNAGAARAAAAEDIPQMFCAYKEVLGLYRQGLKVPEDVTIVWPDDNFGYIRNYATPEEQKRAGGFGVYYHLSYLGAPLAYLWLYSTPPALVWEEMTKAYEHGAQTMWIANVGDIKPAEIGVEFFLQLAWDVKRWRPDNLPSYFETWAAREFGPAHAREIGNVMTGYFALNFQRKPEHLQWWLGKETPRPSPFSREEVDQRLMQFAALRKKVETLARNIGPAKQDAFFELVLYPVIGSALANERYFLGERAAFAAAGGAATASELAQQAKEADAALSVLAKRYHEEVAGGKWRGLINVEPADSQWSFRIKKWELPKFAPNVPSAAATEKDTAANTSSRGPASVQSFEAEAFAVRRPGAQSRWEVIPGLGRTGDAMIVLPTTAAAVPMVDAARQAPVLDYAVSVAEPGAYTVTFYLLPTQPIAADRGLRLAVGVDDAPPREVVIAVRDGSKEWAQGVLNATITGAVPLDFATAGNHVVRIYGTEPGVVLDKLVLHRGDLPPSYFGPAPAQAK